MWFVLRPDLKPVFFFFFTFVTIFNKCILSPDAVVLFSCSLFRGFKVVSENAMHNAQSCLSASLTRSISHSVHSQCCVKASALCQNHPWIRQEEKASPSPWVGRVLIVPPSQLLLTVFRAAGPGRLFIHQSSPFCSWSLLTHSVVKDSDIISEL